MFDEATIYKLQAATYRYVVEHLLSAADDPTNLKDSIAWARQCLDADPQKFAAAAARVLAAADEFHISSDNLSRAVSNKAWADATLFASHKFDQKKQAVLDANTALRAAREQAHEQPTG